jgi:hypothetical protein
VSDIRQPHPDVRRIQIRQVQDPAAPDAMAELQALALAASDRRLAFKLSRRALCADPLSHAAYLMVARVFSVVHFQISSYFAAPDLACKRALLLNPGWGEAWTLRIESYRGYRSDMLARWVGRLGCISPKGAATVTRIKTLFHIDQVQAARELARGALRADEDTIPVALNLSMNFEAEDVPTLEAVARAVDGHPQATADLRSKSALISARLAHRAKDIPKANEALRRVMSHAQAAMGGRFDVETLSGSLGMHSADAWTLERAPRAGNRVGMVMVSGLPRSGTTLMEARIAGHAQVHPLGETYLVEAAYVILRSGFVRRRAAVREMAMALLGQDERPAPGPHDVRWFSEKMPLIVAYEGVARSLMDEVRSVIIVRPFLSTWISGVLMGLGGKHPYFLDPEALYRIYAQHFELAEALFARVEPDQAAVVALEGLAEDPDGVSKALCARLGLPERDPDDTDASKPRIVRTVSQGRVRSAVSRTVSDQYLPYREMLDRKTLEIVDRGDVLRARFLDRFGDRLIGSRD